jgi:predicted nucleic acid-binding protein
VNEKRWSIARLSELHPLVALDANVLIYVLEAVLPLGLVGRALVDAVDEGRIRAVISSVAVIEILAGFARSPDARAFEVAADQLQDLPLRLVPTDSAIAQDAAWLRGAQEYAIGDAIHLATARAAGATVFITNDRRIRPIPRLEVVYLDEIVAA